MTFFFLRYFGFVLLLASYSASATENYRILTSIRPLALIAEDLVREAGLLQRVSVDVLLTPGQSAHHHALKVSQIRKLQAANLVVWVGEDLEYFLAKPMQSHAAGAVISMQETHSGSDPHVWLHRETVNRLLKSLAERLQAQFPDAEIFRAASALQQNLALAEAQRSTEFNELDISRGVLEYHASLEYFLEPLQIRHESLVQVPEQQISLKALLAIKKRTQARCLLADKEEIGQARAYASKLALDLVEIDLLASDSANESFTQYLNSLSEKIKSCFP